MVVQINTLRVNAEMDVSKYAAGAAQKQAADRGMSQSGKEAADGIKALGESVTQTDTKISQAGAGIERLKRQFVTGYAASMDFERALKTVGTGLDKGKISVEQAASAVENLTRKYGQVANASDIAERGQMELSRAVAAANANMATQVRTAEQAALMQRRLGQAANQNNRAAGINAGYQFQDIAVTAFGGMSPLMIGMQQGTQLASVISSMEKPVSGLASAFMSMVNPISLITIGLTAGAAALIQYFTTADSGADGMNADLERQRELIGAVANQWGEAIPALQGYADQLERTKQLSQLNAGIEILNQNTLKDVKTALTDARVSMADLTSQMAGQDTDIILNVQKSWESFAKAAEAGTLKIGDVTAMQGALSDAFTETGIPAINDFAASFDNLSKAAIIASGSVQSVTEAGKAAAAITGRYPSRGTYGGVYRSPDFSMGGTGFILPETVPTPTRRPSRENDDPDVATIINSDGRIISVPTPTGRPNYFDSETSGGVTGRPRDLFALQSQLMSEQIEQYQELRELSKGFASDFINGLRNGEKIGENFGNAILNGLTKSADKQIDRLVDSILGSLFPETSSLGSRQTTLGDFLGAPQMSVGRGLTAANNNRPTGDIAGYISNAATMRGIDPDIALRVARSEGGLESWNLQSNYVKNGVREPSFGPFQLYKGGGLGNAMMRQTGLDPALAANGPAGVDFALDHAAKNGWGAWYGAGKAGIGDWEGINANVAKLGAVAGQAANGVGGLGQALTGLPQALMGPGGGGGILSGLTQFGMSVFAGSGQFASAMLGGGIGLFADGTDSAPGGLAMVGERGRELVNLPRGSQVIPNHRTENLMAKAANGGGNAQPGKVDLHVHVNGGSGDAHIRALAEQGAQKALGDYQVSQARGGINELNRSYSARKA